MPILTTGVPEGVRIGGGALQHSLNSVDMHCVASEMPSQVEIDITELSIGDSIHVSDLLESESRIITDGDVTIVSVLAPRITVEEETDGDEDGGEADVEGAVDADEGDSAPADA